MKSTYESFLKKLKDFGMTDRISEYDMSLAKQYPDAGIAILERKKEYENADTDEKRAAANAGAEQIRAVYGKYTAGNDGMGYYPEKSGSYGADELYRALLNNERYSYDEKRPEYSGYAEKKADAALSELAKKTSEKFEYEPTADALYSAYRKQYLREGKRSAEDTAAMLAANTGGIASSYAASAAAQAANNYNAALTDKIPELYKLAYQRYADDISRAGALYNAYAAAQKSEYGQYADALSQYNTDRNFDYKVYYDDFGRAADMLKFANDMEEAERQKLLDIRKQSNEDREYELDLKKEELAEKKYLDSLSAKNEDTDEDSEKAAYDKAVLAAKYGDYSYLRALGIEPQVDEKGKNTEEDGEDTEDGIYAGLSVNPDYVYVSGYGYMKWSELYNNMYLGTVGCVYNPETRRYSYYRINGKSEE